MIFSNLIVPLVLLSCSIVVDVEASREITRASSSNSRGSSRRYENPFPYDRAQDHFEKMTDLHKYSVSWQKAYRDKQADLEALEGALAKDPNSVKLAGAKTEVSKSIDSLHGEFDKQYAPVAELAKHPARRTNYFDKQHYIDHGEKYQKKAGQTSSSVRQLILDESKKPRSPRQQRHS